MSEIPIHSLNIYICSFYALLYIEWDRQEVIEDRDEDMQKMTMCRFEPGSLQDWAYMVRALPSEPAELPPDSHST